MPVVGRAVVPSWLKKMISPNDNTLVADQTRDANARFPRKDLQIFKSSLSGLNGEDNYFGKQVSIKK